MRFLPAIFLPFFIFFSVLTPSTSSQVPLGPPAVSPSPLQTDLIGVVAAVRGTVEISRPSIIGKVIESGASIYLGDKITTNDKGRLQILLLDETVFTIGPNSAMTIDKFVYDPKTDNGEIKAKIVKGTFRFVTGKIAHKKPSQMRVDLPSGSIGIRGTIVAGQTEGTHSFVMLMGPGEGNNSGNAMGAMTLSNVVNGQTQEVLVNRSGYGSIIEGSGAPPVQPFQVPQEQIHSLISSLSPPPSNPAGDGTRGGGTQTGGAAGSATSGGSSGPAPGTTPPAGSSDTDNTAFAIGSDIGSASDAAGANTFGAAISADGINANIENVDQIDTVTSPAAANSVVNAPAGTTSHYYASQGNPLQAMANTGSYDFHLDIDSTSFGSPNSFVKGSATIEGEDSTFEYIIPKTLFTELNEPASYEMVFDEIHGNLIPNTDSSDPTHKQKARIILQFTSDPNSGLPAQVTHDITVEARDVGFGYVVGHETDNLTTETT